MMAILRHLPMCVTLGGGADFTPYEPQQGMATMVKWNICVSTLPVYNKKILMYAVLKQLTESDGPIFYLIIAHQPIGI